MVFQLTFFSVGRLAPLLLTTAICGYLLRRWGKDPNSRWLTIYFACLSIFNAAYFAGYSLNDPMSGYSWYFACIISVAGVARLQFSYAFPVNERKTEARIALWITGIAAAASIADYLIRVEPKFLPVFDVYSYGAAYNSLWVPLVSLVCFLGSIIVSIRMALPGLKAGHWKSHPELRAAVYLAAVTAVELGVNILYLISRTSVVSNSALAIIMNTTMLLIFSFYVVIYSASDAAAAGFMHRLVGITLVLVLGLISLVSIFIESEGLQALKEKKEAQTVALIHGAGPQETLGTASPPELLPLSRFEYDLLVPNKVSDFQQGKVNAGIFFFQSNDKNYYAIAVAGSQGNWLAAYPYSEFRRYLHRMALGPTLLLLIAFGICVLVFPIFFRASMVRPIEKLTAEIQRAFPGEEFRPTGNEIMAIRDAFHSISKLIAEARQDMPEYSIPLARIEEMVRLEPEKIEAGTGRDLVIQSKVMRQVVEQVKRFREFHQPVLITGETGTGKELIARLIGDPDRSRPFIALNCAAVPENLWESEIFGHIKGAFTDARSSRLGRVREAAGGALFFDEVGEMPLAVQAKLLRLLQEGQFTPVGSDTVEQSQARLLFATNRDLATMVEEGKFREDLLYRISVFTVHLPPLRERTEDIPAIVSYLVQKVAKDHDLPVPELPATTLQRMISYSWPGNIRQLENALIRAMATAQDGILQPEMFPEPDRSLIGKMSIISETTDEQIIPFESAMREQAKIMIRHALKKAGGNKTRAAQLLGLNRSTFRHKIKELGLD